MVFLQNIFCRMICLYSSSTSVRRAFLKAERKILQTFSVLDRHNLDVDPDPTFYFDSDPDPSSDPDSDSDADPDPNPIPNFTLV
jgi:hypothetical protein